MEKKQTTSCSRKECSLPSALAPTAQVELGLNERRAGQPRVCTSPFLSSVELEAEALERESQSIATPGRLNKKARGPGPAKTFCRLEKMPTHPGNRLGRQDACALGVAKAQ